MNVNLTEFQGRAIHGANFAPDTSPEDFHGHGTAVAAIIGSRKYGVAKQVNIISVKIMNKMGEGTVDALLRGLQYVNQQSKLTGRPSIINLSASSDKDEIIDAAVAETAKMDIPVIVSAGNSGIDACEFSPGRERSAYTVGASNVNDRIAFFSNIGRCVNIFAPGESILTMDTDGDLTEEDGTSFATPHVAGVFAMVLSQKHGFWNTKHMYQYVTQILSTKGKLSGELQKSPNSLIYNGAEDMSQLDIPDFDPYFDMEVCPVWKVIIYSNYSLLISQCWWAPNCRCNPIYTGIWDSILQTLVSG